MNTNCITIFCIGNTYNAEDLPQSLWSFVLLKLLKLIWNPERQQEHRVWFVLNREVFQDPLQTRQGGVVWGRLPKTESFFLHHKRILKKGLIPLPTELNPENMINSHYLGFLSPALWEHHQRCRCLGAQIQDSKVTKVNRLSSSWNPISTALM